MRRKTIIKERNPLSISQRAQLEQAFIDHRSTLQGFLYRSVKSRDDVQDLIQECHLRLARSEQRLEPGETVRAYLLTIARNLVIDLFRRRAVSGYHTNADVDTTELLDQTPNPEQSLEFSQNLQKAKRCIQRMPETTRKVFLLSRFEDMTYPQIAATLNISTRTVERKIGDAMLLLSNSLEGRSIHE